MLAIPVLAVNEQDGEIEHIEVRNGDGRASHFVVGSLCDHFLAGEDGRMDDVAGHPGWQAVCPRHQPVAKVVDVAGCAPPSRGQETRATLSLDVFEVSDCFRGQYA